MDGLGEIGEEGLDGARGVRDLFRQQLQADDLMGVGRAGRSHLARSRQVPGQPRVDEIRRDAAAAQESAPRLQDAEFAAPGQIAGGRTVRLQTEQGGHQRRTAKPVWVSKKVVPGPGALGSGEVGLEGAEAQLRPQYAVAVLVHQGRRFDHPDSRDWTVAFFGS